MGLINREADVNRGTIDPPDKKDPAQGTLGIWDTYYDQANPLVIFNVDSWEELTIEKLKALLA